MLNVTNLLAWVALMLTFAAGCAADVAEETTPQANDAGKKNVSPADAPKSTVNSTPNLLPLLDRVTLASFIEGREHHGGQQAGTSETAPTVARPLPTSTNPTAGCRQARQTLQGAIDALETKAAVIADNLANAHTDGFKARRLMLKDRSPRQVILAGMRDNCGNPTSIGVTVGQGTQTAGVVSDFSQGTIQQTNRELDVAIEGEGFFGVADSSGEIQYTRAGRFCLGPNGTIVVSTASATRVILPPISIPSDATDIVINPEGSVSVRTPGSTTLTQVGQFTLARFINPNGLRPLGETLFGETDASGCAANNNPGSGGAGKLRQRMLEASNVEPSKELLELEQVRSSLDSLNQALHRLQ